MECDAHSIWLIGESSQARNILGDALRPLGFEVCICDGRQPAEEKSVPDLVVVFLTGNRCEEVHRLLARPLFMQTKRMYILDAGDRRARMYCATARVDDIVFKPLQIREAMVRILLVLQRRTPNSKQKCATANEYLNAKTEKTESEILRIRCRRHALMEGILKGVFDGVFGVMPDAPLRVEAAVKGQKNSESSRGDRAIKRQSWQIHAKTRDKDEFSAVEYRKNEILSHASKTEKAEIGNSRRRDGNETSPSAWGEIPEIPENLEDALENRLLCDAYSSGFMPVIVESHSRNAVESHLIHAHEPLVTAFCAMRGDVRYSDAYLEREAAEDSARDEALLEIAIEDASWWDAPSNAQGLTWEENATRKEPAVGACDAKEANGDVMHRTVRGVGGISSDRCEKSPSDSLGACSLDSQVQQGDTVKSTSQASPKRNKKMSGVSAVKRSRQRVLSPDEWKRQTLARLESEQLAKQRRQVFWLLLGIAVCVVALGVLIVIKSFQ